jgi:hypothetical protein
VIGTMPLRFGLLVALAAGSALVMMWELRSHIPCHAAALPGYSDMLSAHEAFMQSTGMHTAGAACDSAIVIPLTSSMALFAVVVAAVLAYVLGRRAGRSSSAVGGPLFVVLAAVATALGSVGICLLLADAHIPAPVTLGLGIGVLTYVFALHAVVTAFFGIPWLPLKGETR